MAESAATDESLADVLRALPVPAPRRYRARPCFWLLGKPGAGVTTLLQGWAGAQHALTVIGLEPQLRRAAQGGDLDLTLRQSIDQQLSRGLSVPVNIAEALIRHVAATPHAAYTGFAAESVALHDPQYQASLKEWIFDAAAARMRFPAREAPKATSGHGQRSTHAETTAQSTAPPSSGSAAASEPPAPYVAIPVILHVQLSHRELRRRRVAQRVDPFTGTLYPGAQIAASRAYYRKYPFRKTAHGGRRGGASQAARGENGESGAVDPVEDEDEAVDPQDGLSDHEGASDAEEAAHRGGGGGASHRASTDGLAEQGPYAAPAYANTSLNDPQRWPILSLAVLNRLVRRPEDADAALDVEEAQVWTPIQQFIDTFKAEVVDPHMHKPEALRRLLWLDLPSFQSAGHMMQQLLERLDAMDLLEESPPAEALHMSETFRLDDPLEETVRALATHQLQYAEPARELGPFRHYCPLTFAETHVLLPSTPEYALAYRGALYFPNSAVSREMILARPDKYLHDAAPSQMPRLHLGIVSSVACTGKSTLSQLIAKVYGLRLLSPAQVVDRFNAFLVRWQRAQGAPAFTYQGEPLRHTNPVLRSRDLPPWLAPLTTGGAWTPEFMAECMLALIQNRAMSFEEYERGETGRYADVVQAAVSAVHDATATRGWVLDNFPQTEAQAQQLHAAGLTLDALIVLTGDARHPALAPRFEILQCDALTTAKFNKMAIFPGRARDPADAAQDAQNAGASATQATDESDSEMAVDPDAAAATAGDAAATAPGAVRIAIRPYPDEAARSPAALNEHLQSVKTFLATQSIAAHAIDASAKLTAVLNQALAAVDLFFPTARPVPPDAIPPVPQWPANLYFGPGVSPASPFRPEAAEVELNEDEEATLHAERDALINPPLRPDGYTLWQWGVTGRYCPVKASRGVLVAGRPEHAVVYRQRIYLLSDAASFAAFMAEPHAYMYVISKMAGPPPLRLFVAGCPNTGKKTLTRHLHQLLQSKAGTSPGRGQPPLRLGHAVPTPVAFEDFVLSVLDEVVPSKPEREAAREALKAQAPLDPLVLYRVLNALFFHHNSHQAKPFILTGFPRHLADWDVVEKHQFFPDALVMLTLDAQVAWSRLVQTLTVSGEIQKLSDDDLDQEQARFMAQLMPLQAALADVALAAGDAHLRVLSLETDRPMRPLMAQLLQDAEQLFFARADLFCVAQRLHPEEATVLLQTGRARLNPLYGHQCPVTLIEQGWSSLAAMGTMPVLWDDHIYYCATLAAQKQFMTHLHYYTHDIVTPSSLTVAPSAASAAAPTEEVTASPAPADAASPTTPTTAAAAAVSKAMASVVAAAAAADATASLPLQAIAPAAGPETPAVEAPVYVPRHARYYRPQIAIIGTEKAGKTAVARRLAVALDLVLIEMAQVLALCADPGESVYEPDVVAALQRGEAPTPEQLVACLVRILGTVAPTAKGWILDDVPASVAQCEAMARAGLRPTWVVSIECPPDVSRERATAMAAERRARWMTALADAPAAAGASSQRSSQVTRAARPVLNSTAATAATAGFDGAVACFELENAALLADREANRQLDAIKTYYREQWDNLIVVSDGTSRWQLSMQLSKRFRQVMAERVRYAPPLGATAAASARLAGAAGEAPRLRPMPVAMSTRPRPVVRQSVSHSWDVYCPVCYVSARQLTPVTHVTTDWVELETYAYATCSAAHQARLLAAPETFLGPLDRIDGDEQGPTSLAPAAFRLPEHLPKQLHVSSLRQIFPRQVAFGSYCPATFRAHQRFEEGDVAYMVEYADALYLFVNQAAVDAFLREPQQHVAVLPAQVPPKKVVIPLKQLPLPHYIDAALTPMLKAMCDAIMHVKPKHPYQSLRASAAAWMALYLRANNRASTPYRRQIAQTQLDAFQRNCQLLAALTAGQRDARQFRHVSSDYQAQMDRFLQLRPATPPSSRASARGGGGSGGLGRSALAAPTTPTTPSTGRRTPMRHGPVLEPIAAATLQATGSAPLPPAAAPPGFDRLEAMDA
ncbi:hypothetical protein CXG81DRAFT_20825 [Caulochytrium protostelioides]|uniref:Adenylate kinase n=1 Tax=Caulochytrium protostelioides TaxID=1555241 RepID=A0A4V1IU21_9FUNG|nr:hypothetical protein CXG81DRAFT_20825 [Caulochytrium protostelioides]|eukprot:RKO99037.1 hypothetical protein CXG81DRAFT_20825 [Caulochytrium protostelioides]